MYGLNFNAFYANKFTKLHGSALRCIIPSEAYRRICRSHWTFLNIALHLLNHI